MPFDPHTGRYGEDGSASLVRVLKDDGRFRCPSCRERARQGYDQFSRQDRTGGSTNKITRNKFIIAHGVLESRECLQLLERRRNKLCLPRD